jgi:hypothetical protein
VGETATEDVVVVDVIKVVGGVSMLLKVKKDELVLVRAESVVERGVTAEISCERNPRTSEDLRPIILVVNGRR